MAQKLAWPSSAFAGNGLYQAELRADSHADPGVSGIIGDKEKEANAVGVRSRTDGDIGAMQTDEFVAKIVDEVKTFA